MARRIIPEGVELIKHFEGLSLTPYQDSAAVWTVGHGHTGPIARAGKPINATDAALLLLSDLRNAEEAVERLLPGLADHTFAALVSFTFNLGQGALDGSTMAKRLRAGEDPYQVLPEELPKWVKAGGKVLAGLQRRRQAEVGLAQKDGPRHSLAKDQQPEGQAEQKAEPAVPLDLANFFEHYQAEPHQVAAVRLLGDAIKAKAPELLRSDAAWVKAYRSKAPAVIQLPVPYQYQLDSSTQHGARMCFSSTNAMVVEYLKPGTLRGAQADDAFLAKVLQYGDTTSAEAQVRALKAFGIKAAFRTDGTSKRARELLAAGLPVPMGVLHHGPFTNPTGGGHWVLAVGWDQRTGQWIVHDPYGRMDEIRGGYASNEPTAGRFVRYSRERFGVRWLVKGEGDGWFLEISR